MVDVSRKETSSRVATASGVVHVGPLIAKHIRLNTIKKGDVLSIAEVAGIVAAKRTSDLIPLCHNIPLNSVKVKAELDSSRNVVRIKSTVRCEGRTGVEMEALTAVSVAALTIYDMCKALSHDIRIGDVMLMEKTGGKQDYKKEALKEEIKLKYNEEPYEIKEPFYPLHI